MILGDHLIRRVLQGAAAVLIALTAPVVVAPAALAAPEAQAGPEVCVGTFHDSYGRELFEVEEKYVPPPLRAFPADCASRLTGAPWDDQLGVSFSYSLVYVDIPWTEMVAIVRSFESSEWSAPGLITSLDPAGGGAEADPTGVHVSADQLATMEPVDFLYTRFSNEATRRDIIVFTYTNGTTYQNDSSWTVPSLVIDVIAEQSYDATGIDDPSTLSGLDTIADKLPNAAQTAVIAAGSVMLMLVVGWPSTLLNSVVGSRYAQFVRWADARSQARQAKKRGARLSEVEGDETVDESAVGAPTARRLPGWLMWPGFALAALIGAFTDPDFGLNWMSLRLVVTLLLSFLLFNLLIWQLVKRVALRLQPDSRPYLRFRWGSLLLVLLAVVLSRLLDFEPGVIFGLVAGLAYAVALQASRSAVIVIVGSGIALAFAAVAWVAYSLLAPLAQGDAHFALIFVVEFFAGVTVKGVSSLPLALLPLGTLDGMKLVRWKWWAWAVAYVVGLAAFMMVLLTIPKAWGEIDGDFIRWLVVFLAYGVVAVIAWAVNSWLVARAARRRSADEGEEAGEEPEATTID